MQAGGPVCLRSRRPDGIFFQHHEGKMSFFDKSPHSLPADEYGGAHKRIFIGMMLASCLLLCLCIVFLFILPWLDLGDIFSWLPAFNRGLGVLLIIGVCWLCLTLVVHIHTGRCFPGIRPVRQMVIRLVFPLMEVLSRLVGVDKALLRRSFIKVNNELVLADRKRVRPEELLLLLPHCVQRSACPHRLSYKVDLCRRCGLCPVGGLLDLRDAYGVHLAIATGGTIARRIVVQRKPRCIIAVACERDLTSGIQDSYPLPVFGILNERPNGPCLDTLVPLDRLEEAIRLFLDVPASQPRVILKELRPQPAGA